MFWADIQFQSMKAQFQYRIYDYKKTSIDIWTATQAVLSRKEILKTTISFTQLCLILQAQVLLHSNLISKQSLQEIIYL